MKLRINTEKETFKNLINKNNQPAKNIFHTIIMKIILK